MKKTVMKALCFLMAVGYCGIVLAQAAAGNSCCCPPPVEPRCQPPCKACDICPPCEPCEPCCTEVPVIGEPCKCAYNAPARIDTLCGWDHWVSLSFIYWQASEKGLELGFHDSSIESYHMDFETMNMDFDYLPGFKIGAGMSFCRDNWTLYLEYTRLKSDDCRTDDITTEYQPKNDQTTDPFNLLVSPWFPYFDKVQRVAQQFAQAEAQSTLSYDLLRAAWNIDYNTFDLELGRPYYIGTKLIFKPHFGLRAGWLDQEYNIYGHFNTGSQAVAYYSDTTQDTWFIGPRAGLDSDWLIGYNLRIFGNVAGSLVYQDFETENIESVPFEESILIIGKDDFGGLTPNVEFGLGLGYGTYFCNSTWYFDLTVGYDFHYFWNQNMMRNLVDNLRDEFDHDSGDLKLQGLTITARLDF